MAASKAQKTAVYDMYARFFCWATDRLGDEGIIAFITNRSFIDSRTFDGFRATAAADFNELWLVDLGGDVRTNPKLSGTKNNVFGIQTGVTISFFIKLQKRSRFRIHYARRPEFETAEEKLTFLSASQLSEIAFEELEPDDKFNWLNIPGDEFQHHLSLASRTSKHAKRSQPVRSIFQLFSTGIMSGRDEWVYDFDKIHLDQKMHYFGSRYKEIAKYVAQDELPGTIKWSRDLKRKIGRKIEEKMPRNFPTAVSFRPFVTKAIFTSELYVDELGAFKLAFQGQNRVIAFLCISSANPLAVLASDRPVDYGLLKQGNGGTQALYRYRYGIDGTRLDNITDWALEQFRKQYENGAKSRHPITKDTIFDYVYAVLHDPIYRDSYAQNLKREFPRIPFYAGFGRWAEWGATLMALHIGYETVQPWPLTRIDTTDEKSRKAGLTPKAILKADKDNGNIQLDSETQLTGVPLQAWAYKLGNRSALEWILDQYKEKTPKDPIIREKFNTYRFADYKEKVIDLLRRVTRVSIETTKIVEAMRQLDR